MNLTVQKQNTGISDVTASLIVSVIAWLWVLPVIDSLDSYTYGMATRAIIISFIPFVIGVVAAVAFPNFTSPRKSRWALIIGCILLSITVVFYVIIYQELFLGWWFIDSIAFLRILGFALMGYAMQTITTDKALTFKAGLAILIILYTIYNLLIWGMNNVPCQYMPMYRLANIAYGLVRIAIVVALWKTLSADSVTDFLRRIPKVSVFVAGLFWGMFLVLPADRYSPKWLAIMMLILAPAFAYVCSAVIRFTVKVIIYLIKGLISEKFWWKDVCCWWRQESYEDSKELQGLYDINKH